jgi:hypothetical protein
MVTSVTKGKQKLPKNVSIVGTYWHDHSLESSWGTLSDGTITDSTIFGENILNLSEKNLSQVLMECEPGLWRVRMTGYRPCMVIDWFILSVGEHQNTRGY